LQKFQQRRGEFRQRFPLLSDVERYPTLKATRLPDLRTQLEGPKIVSASRAIAISNGAGLQRVVRQFPQNLTAMVFGYKEKPQFASKMRPESEGAYGGLRHEQEVSGAAPSACIPTRSRDCERKTGRM